MKVAVIGSARGDFGPHFEHMVAEVVVPQDTVLVSGGAAGADHVAVTLFLRGKVDGLELHLPCEWNEMMFVDTGVYYWKLNPGRTANAYHKQFSKHIGRSSLAEIEDAIGKGAKVHVYKGFHERNTAIALSCDKCICFTWDAGAEPRGGGSLDTWRKCQVDKEHICISS